jgi:hypothetical protein
MGIRLRFGLSASGVWSSHCSFHWIGPSSPVGVVGFILWGSNRAPCQSQYSPTGQPAMEAAWACSKSSSIMVVSVARKGIRATEVYPSGGYSFLKSARGSRGSACPSASRAWDTGSRACHSPFSPRAGRARTGRPARWRKGPRCRFASQVIVRDELCDEIFDYASIACAVHYFRLAATGWLAPPSFSERVQLASSLLVG